MSHVLHTYIRTRYIRTHMSIQNATIQNTHIHGYIHTVHAYDMEAQIRTARPNSVPPTSAYVLQNVATRQSGLLSVCKSRK
jgi:hypothetical protein